jgi:hypothetical protein
MGYRFSVDLTALERAAEGVNQVLYESSQMDLTQLPSGSATVGDDNLAGVLGDFCSRWERGIQRLVTEGQQIAERLGYAVYAYSTYEDATRHAAAEGGTVAGDAPDPGTQQ